jgi:hypothetical protein
MQGYLEPMDLEPGRGDVLRFIDSLLSSFVRRSFVWYLSLSSSDADRGSSSDSSLRLLRRSPPTPENRGLTDDLSSTTELSLWKFFFVKFTHLCVCSTPNHDDKNVLSCCVYVDLY